MNTRALAGRGRFAPLAMAALLVGCPRPDPLPLLDSGAEGDGSDVGTLDMPAVERDVLEVGVDVPPAPMDTGPDVPGVDVPVLDDGPIDTGSRDVAPVDADVAEAGMVDDRPDVLLPPTDNGTTVCPAGRTACGSACRDLANDSSNCGTCDRSCVLTNATSACQASTCRVVTCFSGYADCDGNAANGCEVNTTTGNVANCGRCGMQCPMPAGTTAVCNGGVCGVSTMMCGAGTGNCDGMDANGCETTTLTDAANCGPGGMVGSASGVGCGMRCSSVGGTPSCAGGTCAIACSAGMGNCDGSAANGCETDTRTSVAHCGGCGVVCSTNHVTPACAVGSCAVGTCAAGFGDCDGNKQTNGCELPLVSDVANCGACGRACPAAQTCMAGSCVPRCPAGMQYIPAGMFQMGGSASDSAAPVHGVRVSAFCMDTTEVTVAAYRMCTAGGCSAPDMVPPCNWTVGGRDSHPINCIDWNQSRAYCQWRMGDLPTEAQWEYAARGTDGRLYPWGSAPAPGSQLCWNGVGPGLTSTCVVGSFPAGNSPFGLVDMAGNVNEWVLDWWASPYTESAGSYVMDPTGPTSGNGHPVRGGAWSASSAIEVRASRRSGDGPTARYFHLGFRCARGAL